MIHRINRKKYNIYAFDIESHNDEESIAKGETSMWLGCFLNEKSTPEDESSYMYNMDEFITRIEELSSVKRKNAKENRPVKNVAVYIYNLSFEYSFILPYLLKYGFKYKEVIEKNDEYVFNSVSTKTCSSVWCVEIKFHKNSGIVLLRDLAKIYGGGLANVAKSFNLPVQKGEIDYRLNRLHNYKVTPEEKDYCYRDVAIIIEILKIMYEKDDKEFWNASSMATYSMKRLLKRGYPRAAKPYQKFREDYPELGKEETDFLRKGVGGGITYAPSRYQFKDIRTKIIHVDAHNMHPTQMYEKLFPYGYGTYFKGEPPFNPLKINCCRIRISYSSVKLHSVISLIGVGMISDRELVVWDFEIPTMKKVYENLEIEYLDGYSYNAKPLPFRKYPADNYTARLKAKKEKDAFGIMYYKLLNNSSYGKFLEKPHNFVFENTLDAYGIINSNVIEKPLESQEINAKFTYIPVGSCIPAYSRVSLIEHALLMGWENIVYFDTDSIFAIYNDRTAKSWEKDFNHEDFLGGWSLEEIADKIQVAAPKRYKIETDGVVTIKAGGINFKSYIEEQASKSGIIPEDYRVSYDEINIVSSKWKVQRAYRVKGGTIIEFQDKEMKIPDKYKAIYENNIEGFENKE